MYQLQHVPTSKNKISSNLLFGFRTSFMYCFCSGAASDRFGSYLTNRSSTICIGYLVSDFTPLSCYILQGFAIFKLFIMTNY